MKKLKQGETMTGAYLRVKRNGKFENIEVEHLTDAEREKLLKDDPRLINWLHLVCEELVEYELLFNLLVDEGILENG